MIDTMGLARLKIPPNIICPHFSAAGRFSRVLVQGVTEKNDQPKKSFLTRRSGTSFENEPNIRSLDTWGERSDPMAKPGATTPRCVAHLTKMFWLFNVSATFAAPPWNEGGTVARALSERGGLDPGGEGLGPPPPTEKTPA